MGKTFTTALFLLAIVVIRLAAAMYADAPPWQKEIDGNFRNLRHEHVTGSIQGFEP
jgi:hypothetical protein